MGRVNSPSPNQISAAELVLRLADTHQVIVDIDRRGGIVVVFDEAQINEAGRTKLVTILQLIAIKTRSYIAAIGDDRRARGVAPSIPWFPESKTPAEHPHDTAGDSVTQIDNGSPKPCPI
jgi:hypothetical protein